MKNCRIINKTLEAKNEAGWLYGGETYVINKEELEALKQGKCLCTNINSGEYRIFIELEETNEEEKEIKL